MKKIKPSEILTLIISSVATVIIAVGAVRFYAPQLLGISSDIQLVKTSKKVPPFFDGVFRLDDYQSDEYILPDPFIKRAKPFFPNIGGMGPNDLLGFRNRSIPNITDVIIIGDSQTYGNNAVLEENWPNHFVENLKKQNKYITHYDMAVGGWGAIEYLEIFYKSLIFQPRMVVVAFYTGNDPLETFRLAYSNEKWEKYQVDKSLSLNDMPKVEFPPLEKDLWNVKFEDNVSTVFTPKNRMYSNENSKVVKAGYDAMLMVAKEIASVCNENNITPVFTIIPTKELVYKKKVINDVSDPLPIYKKLITQEQEYIDWFEDEFSKIPDLHYVDLVETLQNTALEPVALYPNDANGHPVNYGYKLIADELASKIKLSWQEPEGLVALFSSETKYQLGLVRDGYYLTFSHPDIIEANGWDSEIAPTSIQPRDIANFPNLGMINIVDKDRFGPR